MALCGKPDHSQRCREQLVPWPDSNFYLVMTLLLLRGITVICLTVKNWKLYMWPLDQVVVTVAATFRSVKIFLAEH